MVNLKEKYPKINLGIIDYRNMGDPSINGMMSHRPYIPQGSKVSRGVLEINKDYLSVKTLNEFNRLQKISFEAGFSATKNLTEVVTHEMGFARKAASRVCMLDHGIILEENTPEKMFTSPTHPRTREFLSKII